MCEIIEYPRTSDWHDRICRTEDIIKKLKLPPNSSILDIGGKDYKELCKKLKIRYVMIDLEEPLKTGTSSYNRDVDGLTYDGRHLPFREKTFDLVIVNFVLHHAGSNTFPLLAQIQKISKKYVLIGEDLSDIAYEKEWHKRNYVHQPGGFFRSDEEWRELFRMFSYTLKKQYIIRRTDDPDKNKVYRCMYFLEV